MCRLPPVGAAALTAVGAWESLLQGVEVAYRGVEPGRPGRSEPLPAALHPAVAEVLTTRGVTGLYAHQAETWEAVAQGESVVVTTGTASGKSIAFSLPVLDAIAREPTARALYLYPTKALAQDQARWLAGLGLKGLRPAIYDGDTPVERRAHVRRSANAILTNPDMLHVGVLPHHDRWGDVLHNLRAVVVDEAHVYRGVFGSHVANVLRRLRRLARAYGSEPVFVLASATIANAGELATRLTGLDVRVVDVDTSSRAEREVVLWNPELLDEELGVRASALGDASRLLAGPRRGRAARHLLHEEPQGRRAGAPLRERPAGHGDRAAARPVPRRLHAGAAPRDRAAASSRGSCWASRRPTRSSSGSTSACSTARSRSGSPGPSPRLRQQWGRAGRRRRGLAVLVASEDALDQFFMHEPAALLERPASRRRSSTTRRRGSSTGTCSAPPTRGR